MRIICIYCFVFIVHFALACCHSVNHEEVDQYNKSVLECLSSIKQSKNTKSHAHGLNVIDFVGEDGEARLRLVGLEHSRDPKHTQFDVIEEMLYSFSPSIVYYEGLGSTAGKCRDQSIYTGGEPRYLRYLARENNIISKSFEPSKERRIVRLTKSYGPLKAQLFLLLRRVHTYRSRGFDEKKVERRLNDYIKRDFSLDRNSIKWPISNYSELSTIFTSEWPEFSFEEFPGSWFDPTQSSVDTGGRYLNEINSFESDFRNREIFRNAFEGAREHGRLMAFIGVGHFEALEPAFECMNAARQ